MLALKWLNRSNRDYFCYIMFFIFYIPSYSSLNYSNLLCFVQKYFSFCSLCKQLTFTVSQFVDFASLNCDLCAHAQCSSGWCSSWWTFCCFWLLVELCVYYQNKVGFLKIYYRHPRRLTSAYDVTHLPTYLPNYQLLPRCMRTRVVFKQ